MEFPPPDTHHDSANKMAVYLDSIMFEKKDPVAPPEPADVSLEAKAPPPTNIDSFNTDITRLPVPADFMVFDSPVVHPNTMSLDFTSNDPGRSVTVRSRAHWNPAQTKINSFHNRFHLFHRLGSQTMKHCFTMDPAFFQFHSEFGKERLEVKLGELQWLRELVPFYRTRTVRDFSKWDITMGAIGIEDKDNWKGSFWRLYCDHLKFREQGTTTAIWRQWGLFFSYRYEMSLMRIWECRSAHVACGYEDSPIKFCLRAKSEKAMKWWEWYPEEIRAQLGYKFDNGSFAGVEATLDTGLEDWDVGVAGKARLGGDTWYLGGMSTKGSGWLGVHTFLGDDTSLLVAANVETDRRSDGGGLMQPVTGFEVRLAVGVPFT